MKENLSVKRSTKAIQASQSQEISNPGVDQAIWERMNHKWSELVRDGHEVRVEFRLIGDPRDDTNILGIDVVQHIGGEVVTETVQRNPGEAYAVLGIAGLSQEGLENVYEKMMQQLHRQLGLKKDVALVVTMCTSSSLSGEVRGYTERRGSAERRSVLVNYQHYYVLNALREKRVESTGEACNQVKAVYRAGELEIYFE